MAEAGTSQCSTVRDLLRLLRSKDTASVAHLPSGRRPRSPFMQFDSQGASRQRKVDEEPPNRPRATQQLQVGAEVLLLAGIGQLGDVLGQLPAGVLPREVGVGLAEAELAQVAHHGALGRSEERRV